MLGEIFRLLLLILAMIAGALQTVPEPTPEPTRSAAPFVIRSLEPDPCADLEDIAEDDEDLADEIAEANDCDWE